MKTFEMNVLGNEVTVNVTSSDNIETKKEIILTLTNLTDPERAWENHKNDMIVGIKTCNQENGRVVFNIFVDERQTDLSDSTNVEYIKFKISNDLATQFLQDYYMEGMDNDIKLSELNIATPEGATLGDIRVALQMAVFNELSEAFKEKG